MNCIDCGNEMVILWTRDVGHSGSPSGGGHEHVCQHCTPDYFRRHS